MCSLFSLTQVKDLYYRHTTTGLIMNIRLTPGAHNNKVTGMYHDDSGAYLAVSVTKPPVNEQANQELILFIAKILKVPKTSCRLRKGAHGRFKQLQIDDDVDEELLKELGNPPVPTS